MPKPQGMSFSQSEHFKYQQKTMGKIFIHLTDTYKVLTVPSALKLLTRFS